MYSTKLISILSITLLMSAVPFGTTQDDTVIIGAINSNFQCVPAGSCPYSTSPTGNEIDIRIVTPAVPCPAGQEPCYYPCGVRKITNPSTADGPATNGAYPWQAYLEINNAYVGSGVLLDRYHVLTAAHKVYASVATPGIVRVTMGVYDPNNRINTQTTTVSSIKVYDTYTENPKLLKDDIAILRLTTPIDVISNPNVAAACYPSPTQMFPAGTMCAVAGWGETQFMLNDAPTSPQKQVTVPIVDIAACRTALAAANVLGNNVDKYLDQTGGELCAGGLSMRDACTLDGGTPLMCPSADGRQNIAGLVIWGKGCGRTGVPGVYVNVQYYAQWIFNTITALNAAAIAG